MSKQCLVHSNFAVLIQTRKVQVKIQNVNIQIEDLPWLLAPALGRSCVCTGPFPSGWRLRWSHFCCYEEQQQWASLPVASLARYQSGCKVSSGNWNCWVMRKMPIFNLDSYCQAALRRDRINLHRLGISISPHPQQHLISSDFKLPLFGERRDQEETQCLKET